MKNKELRIDFLTGPTGYRSSRCTIKNELIAKAVGIKSNYRPTVIDATAGLGRDAFILASLGCKVLMLERCPQVAELLTAALTQISQPLALNLNLHLIQTNAIEYLTQLQAADYPEVIYLDPMFPERTKSALVKKEMRILKEWVGNDEDAPALLQIALTRAQKRVVVKRPRLAPTLSELNPNFTIEGKKQRFDVYLV